MHYSPKPAPHDGLTARDAAKMLGIGQYRLWKSAACGLIKTINVPGFPIVFDRASVEAYAALVPPKQGPAKRKPAALA